ncbi:hypothetical protein AALB81_09205 [Lachnospiraceae bacterium 48-33]
MEAEKEIWALEDNGNDAALNIVRQDLGKIKNICNLKQCIIFYCDKKRVQ